MKKEYWKEKDGKYLLEQEAQILSYVYYKKLSSMRIKHINSALVKKTKYWKYFVDVVSKYSLDERWDAYKYIDSVFEYNGLTFPQQLSRKDFWGNYLGEYDRLYKRNGSEIAKELLNSYRAIEKWSLKKGYKKINIKAYFNNKLNLLLLDRGSISLYFLSICKSFKDYYFSLDVVEKRKLISSKELESKRRSIFINKKIKNKMMQVLGEEFDGRRFL